MKEESKLFPLARKVLLAADRRTHLGICQVPEGRQVFGPMSVADNLLLGACTRGDKAGVQEDLERMYAMFPILRQKAKQAAGTLSDIGM